MLIKNMVNARLCILIGSFYPMVGGGETHAKLLAEHLVRKGIPLFVLTRRIIEELSNFEIIGKVPVYRIRPSGFKRWGKYLWLIPASVKLYRMRKNYDIIYVCGLRIAGVVGVLVGMILGKKCILRAESCGELSGEFIWNSTRVKKNSIPGIIIKILIFLRNSILKKANCFLSISQTIRDEYLRCAVDPKKIVKIPNGIDTNKFRPIEENGKRNLRQRLGLPSKTIFTYTGKLNKGKGLELLLTVWLRIISKHDDVHLLLVGAGDYQFLSCEKELKLFVRKHQIDESVTFTGYVSNVHEYLQCSNNFVFPSENEALGISILEALSCELPAICTKAGGIVDIISDNVNGKLVDVGDEEGLYNGINEVIKDKEKAKEMGKNGRKTVMNRFSINTVSDRHIELFSSLFID